MRSGAIEMISVPKDEYELLLEIKTGLEKIQRSGVREFNRIPGPIRLALTTLQSIERARK